jgi:hypothetical protein
MEITAVPDESHGCEKRKFHNDSNLDEMAKKRSKFNEVTESTFGETITCQEDYSKSNSIGGEILSQEAVKFIYQNQSIHQISNLHSESQYIDSDSEQEMNPTKSLQQTQDIHQNSDSENSKDSNDEDQNYKSSRITATNAPEKLIQMKKMLRNTRDQLRRCRKKCEDYEKGLLFPKSSTKSGNNRNENPFTLFLHKPPTMEELDELQLFPECSLVNILQLANDPTSFASVIQQSNLFNVEYHQQQQLAADSHQSTTTSSLPAISTTTIPQLPLSLQTQPSLHSPLLPCPIPFSYSYQQNNSTTSSLVIQSPSLSSTLPANSSIILPPSNLPVSSSSTQNPMIQEQKQLVLNFLRMIAKVTKEIKVPELRSGSKTKRMNIKKYFYEFYNIVF